MLSTKSGNTPIKVDHVQPRPLGHERPKAVASATRCGETAPDARDRAATWRPRAGLLSNPRRINSPELLQAETTQPDGPQSDSQRISALAHELGRDRVRRGVDPGKGSAQVCDPNGPGARSD